MTTNLCKITAMENSLVNFQHDDLKGVLVVEVSMFGTQKIL